MIETTPYVPTPLELDDVKVAARLDGLVERLAENAHETWASLRLGDGWTLGPKRDDEKKTHPCLIPYDDLPESEKKYDRELVVNTVKAILVLGYKIEKKKTRSKKTVTKAKPRPGKATTRPARHQKAATTTKRTLTKTKKAAAKKRAAPPKVKKAASRPRKVSQGRKKT